MKSADLWEQLGSLEEDQALQVLTQLFGRYEQRLRQQPQDPEATLFFQQLTAILEQVQSCNVNRR